MEGDMHPCHSHKKQSVLLSRLCSTHKNRQGTSDNHAFHLSTRWDSTGPQHIKVSLAVRRDGAIKWIPQLEVDVYFSDV